MIQIWDSDGVRGEVLLMVWSTLWRLLPRESRWGGAVPDLLGGLGGQGGEHAGQGTERIGQTTRATRYAH